MGSDSVRELFSRLLHIVGPAELGRMIGGADPDAFRSTWAEHLGGFTRAEIARGLAEASNRRFPFRLGEFKNWCRPALDPEVAWHEAEMGLRDRDRGLCGEWTHPAVFRAASRLAREVRTGDFTKHRARWSAVLKRELSHGIGEWPGPPALAIGVEPVRTGPPPDEVRYANLELRRRIVEQLAKKETEGIHEKEK